MTTIEKMASVIEPLIPDACHQKSHAEAVALEIARAALQAIRDLDAAALAVGAEENRALTYNAHMDSETTEEDEAAASIIWAAMIDAILAEQP